MRLLPAAPKPAGPAAPAPAVQPGARLDAAALGAGSAPFGRTGPAPGCDSGPAPLRPAPQLHAGSSIAPRSPSPAPQLHAFGADAEAELHAIDLDASPLHLIAGRIAAELHAVNLDAPPVLHAVGSGAAPHLHAAFIDGRHPHPGCKQLDAVANLHDGILSRPPAAGRDAQAQRAGLASGLFQLGQLHHFQRSAARRGRRHPHRRPRHDACHEQARQQPGSSGGLQRGLGPT